MTFTLPYAGATRIRFKGLPELIRLSVCVRADTPSIASTLNKAVSASQQSDQHCPLKPFKRFKPFTLRKKFARWSIDQPSISTAA